MIWWLTFLAKGHCDFPDVVENESLDSVRSQALQDDAGQRGTETTTNRVPYTVVDHVRPFGGGGEGRRGEEREGEREGENVIYVGSSSSFLFENIELSWV